MFIYDCSVYLLGFLFWESFTFYVQSYIVAMFIKSTLQYDEDYTQSCIVTHNYV